MAGLTLDSGALIGFERFDRSIMAHLKEASRLGSDLVVSTAVVAEVWRGGRRSARVAALLAACVVEPVDEGLARCAGEAMAAARSIGVVDAIVMASAARRADRVLTSDAGDLNRLRSCFPAVRIVAI